MLKMRMLILKFSIFLIYFSHETLIVPILTKPANEISECSCFSIEKIYLYKKKGGYIIYFRQK